MIGVKALSSAFLLVFVPLVSSQQSYTWNRLYPQSCECVEGAVAKTECDLYKCTCTCDVTAGVCDYNCCCDPDCSIDQMDRFQFLDVCSFERVDADTTTYCYSSTELYGVNPRPPMGGQSSAQEALGQALCVVKTNYAYEGQFFDSDNTAVVANTVFDESAGEKPYSYLDTDATTLAPDQYYDQNDTIAAFVRAAGSDNNTTTTLVSNGPGFLLIPSTDYSGHCNDENYASFQNNVAARTCQRPLSDNAENFRQECVTVGSVGKYVNDLWIAKYALVSASTIGTTQTKDTVNIALASVRYLDPYTQNTSNVTMDWLDRRCNTTVKSTSDLSAGDPCWFQSADSGASLTGSEQYCLNHVHEVKYTVKHSESGIFGISSVDAYVIVTDVPMPLTGVRDSSAPQTFGIIFDSVNSLGISQENGNEVQRLRSGNPGYLLGYPVLFGVAKDSKVAQHTNGLQVPSPVIALTSPDNDNSNSATGGMCPRSLSNATTYLTTTQSQQATVQVFGSSSVLFGFDVSSGCAVSVTRQQFEEMCCVNSDNCAPRAVVDPYYSPYVDSNGIPYFFRDPTGVIGIYGNADPLDISQWEPMDLLSLDNADRQWIESSSTCTNMPSEMVIEFLVASSGEKANPQNKIISTRARIRSHDVVMKIPAGDTMSTQTIPLSVTVTFVFQDAQLTTGYAPPAPPVLFEVPANIFHPFTGLMGGAPRLGPRPWLALMAMAVAGVVCWV